LIAWIKNSSSLTSVGWYGLRKFMDIQHARYAYRY
jgi:hypothetical protein